VARRLGLMPGQVQFRVKTVTALKGSWTEYKVAGQPVKIPLLRATKVVLTGEPAPEAAPGKPWRGDYQFSVGSVKEFPGGGRLEDGLRWTSFPAGVADEPLQRDLALMARSATIRSGRSRSAGPTMRRW